MRSGIALAGVIGACLYASLSHAGESGISSYTSPVLRSVVTLLGGYANINAGTRQTFLGDDDNVFIYRTSGGGESTGFIGGFLGYEHDLPWYNLFGQLGFEYVYYGPVTPGGQHTVGIEPETSTLYHFKYRFQAQQFLASMKLLTTTYERFHPYFSLGLGTSVNNMGRFTAITQETGSINLTASYKARSSTQFGYAVGLGVESDVYQHVRVGIGYRFSGFGDVSLKDPRLAVNGQALPVPFRLGVNNAYANQFIAHISYVI
ncbi:MAG: hypothetical protein BGO90_09220 [Legionella sp. 40-6]|nr:outer membrane beta-barrel protein [Legionella sp.]OJY54795.1 MAG: hypothetical protein BGO90_09220 [Legionella sp. 40-6]